MVGQERSRNVAFVRHGFEFNNAENFPVFPGAGLREENSGAFVGEVQGDGNREENRRSRNQHTERERKIQKTLEEIFVHFQKL